MFSSHVRWFNAGLRAAVFRLRCWHILVMFPPLFVARQQACGWRKLIQGRTPGPYIKQYFAVLPSDFQAAQRHQRGLFDARQGGQQIEAGFALQVLGSAAQLVEFDIDFFTGGGEGNGVAAVT